MNFFRRLWGYANNYTAQYNFSNDNRPNAFKSLYDRATDPITYQPVPNNLTIISRGTTFKDVMADVFGYSSPMITSLTGSKMIIEVEVQEYEQELIQPSALKSIRRRIVKHNGNAILDDGIGYGAQFYKENVGLHTKKKEKYIDYSLFLKDYF